MKENVLYHYTNIESFNAIYRSGIVWASDCRYLNDREEFIRAKDMFLACSDEQVREMLKIAFNAYGLKKFHCVFSLSRSPKVLSQWRAYGDDGKGVSIGIYVDNILSYKKYPSASLVECIYEKQEEFISNLKDICSEEIVEIVRMFKSTEDIAWNSAGSLIDVVENNCEPIEKIICQLLKVKNAAFLEEQETRLVLNVPISEVKTRSSNGLIIPYVEHDLFPYDENHLSPFAFVVPEVWFGPKCDKRNIEVLRSMGHLGWFAGDTLKQYDCGYV